MNNAETYSCAQAQTNTRVYTLNELLENPFNGEPESATAAAAALTRRMRNNSIAFARTYSENHVPEHKP